MADPVDRVESAYKDVLAVEHHAPGMCKVVTWNDAYIVDARHGVCQCKDYEYNLDGGEKGDCKHLIAAKDATDQLPFQTFELVESVNERAVMADGGRPDGCNCPEGHELETPCFQCFLNGFDTAQGYEA